MGWGVALAADCQVVVQITRRHCQGNHFIPAFQNFTLLLISWLYHDLKIISLFDQSLCLSARLDSAPQYLLFFLGYASVFLTKLKLDQCNRLLVVIQDQVRLSRAAWAFQIFDMIYGSLQISHLESSPMKHRR